MELGLKDKVVLVTGANGGIGVSICRDFLSEGAHVVAFIRGTIERLSEITDWMRGQDIPEHHLTAMNVDISDKIATENAVSELIRQFKKIDILVNNAGHAIETPFLATTDEEWEDVMSFNLNATARLTRLVVRQMMREKRGSVINISSVVGQAVGRGVAAYATAKSGINRLTEILALEVGRKGIRINAVAPGAINTKMSGPLMARVGDFVLDRTPMNRVGQPDEVAKAVLFLASEKTASFITGHILNVDGGISL